MRIEFELEDDKKIYVEWTAALKSLFGDRMYAHHDLYELTHLHRIQHNRGVGDGPCNAWPSPPYRAPMWPIVVAMVQPTRFLEVGCGLGYTAALMADAGGPDVRVDTIESVPLHADLAETELSRRGLAGPVCILRGHAEDVLPTLTRPYDVVFDDGGGREETRAELQRLTGQGGVVIDTGPLNEEIEGIVALLKKSSSTGREDMQRACREAEERYREAVGRSMTVR